MNRRAVWSLGTMVLAGFAMSAPPAAERQGFAMEARRQMQEIQREFALGETGLYREKKSADAPAFMWGNGVMFSALAGAARHDAATYAPLMERMFVALDRYWDTRAPIPGYEPAPIAPGTAPPRDKYYDDNQWMVITFVEAFELTGDGRYLQRARETLAFSLSGWDDRLGGGIWWHEQHKDGSKNTCSNAPAAVAALAVARHVETDTQRAWAKRLVEWTQSRLRREDHLYADKIRVADGVIDFKTYSYNAALMIRANLGLYEATRDPKYLIEARRTADACDAFVDATTGASVDPMFFAHLLVEADVELSRVTGEPRYRERAVRVVNAALAKHRDKPAEELLERAGLARALWLLSME